MELNKIHNVDCIEFARTLPENSIDSIVTDPPYELGFMGKSWDKTGIANNIDMWKECLRILKPGGHLLSFGGSRTYHRMACAIEDAGFEIRDQIMWVYGSGFPKSLNIGKAVDKRGGKSVGWFGEWLRNWREENEITQKEIAKLFPSKTGGLTGCVANWELGLNIPTNEQFNLICKTFNLPFENLEEAEREFIKKDKNWGEKSEVATFTGGQEWDVTKGNSPYEGWGTALKPAHEPICLARKPLSEKTVAENVLKWGTGGLNIDGSRVDTKGEKTGGSGKIDSWREKEGRSDRQPRIATETSPLGRFPANFIHDGIETEWARYFYCAKASKSDRGQDNNHPTVKPIKLMTYLIKLVTLDNGVVFDPFLGSGTTAVAAKQLGRNYIGCEISEEYCKIAEKRLEQDVLF